VIAMNIIDKKDIKKTVLIVIGSVAALAFVGAVAFVGFILYLVDSLPH
jgi:hypothetical protein